MHRMPDIDVLLLGAVPQEIRALTEILLNCRTLAFRGQTLWWGNYAQLVVVVAATGLGKVNAAITTASLLEWLTVSQVWHLGCTGAYSGGPLGIGDVLITDRILCGDEGVLTRGGLMAVSRIGIPILVHRGEEFFDRVPLCWNEAMRKLIETTPPGCYRQRRGSLPSPARPCVPDGLERSEGAAGRRTSAVPAQASFPRSSVVPENDEGFRLHYGPSLTVGMTSGDPEVAGERFRRYGAYAENMEGSAVAQTCCRFTIPMIECRGVSNFAGTRAKEAWELETSVAHCHGIIMTWLNAADAMQRPSRGDKA